MIVEETQENINTYAKIDTNSADHQSWGNQCDAWTLLQTNNLSILEERMPSNTCDELHYHTTAHQFIYVLEGELSVNIENVRIVLSKNQGLHIPAGAKHWVSNQSQNQGRFLLISSPYHREDRVLVGGK